MALNYPPTSIRHITIHTVWNDIAHEKGLRTMNSVDQLRAGYETLLQTIRLVSEDCARDLERLKEDGLTNPMTEVEFRGFLDRCVDTVCIGADRRGDNATSAYLRAHKMQIIDRVTDARKRNMSTPRPSSSHTRTPIQLLEHEGLAPRAVQPVPVFHGRRIAVREGFVDISQLRLWESNKRLSIHVDQFTKAHGRTPNPADLLAIMSSDANLGGLDKRDQFAIIPLARSIAASGVRVPPVVSYEGALLDGNRRVAACIYVRNSDEFDSESKSRAGRILVWRLTEDATRDDEHAVVVSRNFEPDYKVQWPEYVRGRILYDEWCRMLTLEGRPTQRRLSELKRELAKRFALTTNRINRYIAMVELADEFEEHQVNNRHKDEYEVKHRADQYFQYFDELGKGRGAGGVNWAMNQDPSFKGLVFDLLHDGKFRRWAQIRDLKHVYENEEALGYLRSARDANDVELGQERVDDGLSVGRAARADMRKVGGNRRIATFVKWLREVPVEFFSVGEPQSISDANLKGLYGALKLVEVHVPEDMRDDAAAGKGVV